MIKTSIKIMQRTKQLSDGTFPIVMRIIKGKKSKIISLGFSCKKEEWDGTRFTKKFKNSAKRNLVLSNYESKALTILDNCEVEGIDFSLNDFEAKFRGKENSNITVLEIWKDKISDLVKAGKTGNARAYRDTMNSFFKFESNHSLSFKEITLTKLTKYETYLRSNNNTNGGISIKMRTFRALYNDAIKKEIVSRDYYPFKDYNISALKTEGNKRALTSEELSLIKNLDTSLYPDLNHAKNLFMFSFYSRGMNFIDMLTLKWTDIQDEKIIYTRSKTKKRFVIKIIEPIELILNQYSSETSKYIFDMMPTRNLTPMQVEYHKDKVLKKFNNDLKDIAKILGIKKNITSYVARHSYATFLKMNNVSTDMISESMGHANVNVTTTYLKQFENDVIDDANNTLLDL